jgi:hypothetical protein
MESILAVTVFAVFPLAYGIAVAIVYGGNY